MINNAIKYLSIARTGLSFAKKGYLVLRFIKPKKRSVVKKEMTSNKIQTNIGTILSVKKAVIINTKAYFAVGKFILSRR